jgi:hypothetical protein
MCVIHIRGKETKNNYERRRHVKTEADTEKMLAQNQGMTWASKSLKRHERVLS